MPSSRCWSATIFRHSDVPRKGVPQGRHAHGLLARGRSVIENFFPGWTDEVVACGGAKGDIAGDVNWIGHGVTIKSAPSELVGLLASRPVLEGHVRRRLMALPNVRVIENCAVQGLIADNRAFSSEVDTGSREENASKKDSSRTRIKGVRVKVGNGVEQTMTADLVVDASGRGSSSLVAAQEAALLCQCLDAGETDLARRFFAAAATAIDTPWDIAVGNDLRHPQVTGPRSPKVRFINWYIGRLHMAARHDAKLATAFLEVANLEAPPTRLLHPSIVMRVISGNLGMRGNAAATPAGVRA
jgi:hypothetical protein